MLREELAAVAEVEQVAVYSQSDAPPDDPAWYLARTTSAVSFLADYDGAISRTFGAGAMPRTIVLDPMLRAVANIPWDHADGHAATVRQVLASLPAVDG